MYMKSFPTNIILNSRLYTKKKQENGKSTTKTVDIPF